MRRLPVLLPFLLLGSLAASHADRIHSPMGSASWERRGGGMPSLSNGGRISSSQTLSVPATRAVVSRSLVASPGIDDWAGADLAATSSIGQTTNDQGRLHGVGSTAEPIPGQFGLKGAIVPEPGSLVLLGSGLIGLAGILRRHVSRT